MNLKAFVAETLSSIIEGVSEAQERYPAGSGSAAVNHLDRAPDAARTPSKPTQVLFDIAVTTETERHADGERKGGVNIKVLEAAVGSHRGAKQRDEAASRIQFSVPLSLPVTHTSHDHDKVARIRDAMRICD